MTGNIFISDGIRLKLPTIFRQLGVKQREVANAVGVSPASISRFTSTGPDRMNLRPERIERLVSFLDEQFAKCRAVKSLSYEELEERRKTDRYTVEAAVAMTKDIIKTLENDLEELLAGGPGSGDTAAGTIFAMPGGPLTLQARNYVARKAEKNIEGILRDAASPASIVLGPIHGGTSSFLERVYQRARDMRGCRAYIVHFEAAFAKGETFTQLDLFRFLFREMGADEILVNKNLDVHDLKDAFELWAASEWKDATRVVMVVDGLDEIFKNAGSVSDPLAVTNWFQALRHGAASGTPPYDRLVLFVALTGSTWSAAHGSPYASQAGPIDLNKFTKEEVMEVFKQLQVDIDEAGIEDVNSLFHGHPYLTQLFAWSMRDGSNRQAAREAALGLEGRYEMHWERMKTEIDFLVGKNYPIRNVLAVVAKIASQPKPEPLQDAQDAIWRSYRRGLRMFGLVDGTFAAPTICEFYQAAIEREG